VNAIEMLKRQHREVEELFEELEGVGENAKKSQERVFQQIADALAVHSEIEEKIFYPEAKEAVEDAEDELREAVEEHLSVKRIIADLMQSGPQDEQFLPRCQVLKEQVEHHVHEEEQELLPKVQSACSKEQLEEMGDRMQQLADELEEEGQPSAAIPDQTDSPSQI